MVCPLLLSPFTNGADRAGATAELAADWPYARHVRDDAAVVATMAQVFAAQDTSAPLHLLLHGTNFQIKVWQALLALGSGQAASYATIARLAGAPRAPRAVGSAIAANRIALLIPLHRVIRESGDFGEYRWGSERKWALLAYEAATRPQPGLLQTRK